MENKEAILRYYLDNKIKSASEIDSDLKLSKGTTTLLISRNPDLFEQDHKELNKKFWRLSEKGKAIVGNLIKEEALKTYPNSTPEAPESQKTEELIDNMPEFSKQEEIDILEKELRELKKKERELSKLRKKEEKLSFFKRKEKIGEIEND